MSQPTPALTVQRAEEIIRQLTDGLVNIKDETGQFLLKLDDGSVIDTKGWQGWEWTHGIALTALYHHSAIAPGSPSADYSLKTALGWFESQYKISNGKGAPKNINTMSPFYSLAAFLLDGSVKDERWLGWCEEWAEWVMNDLPRTQEGGYQHITYSEVNFNQMWDDTLMMTVIPLTKIGVLLNRPHYIEEAKFQFLTHINYLMDPRSGLWYHGWEFTPEGPTSGHNFANALWARGNCWITVAIPLRQVDALVKCQDLKTGLWHTLLIDRTSYVESSAAAGFAAGMFMAIRMGLLPASPVYLQSATLALTGVIAQIRPDGELENTSFGTGMGRTLQFYHDIPITSMPYGQALAMLALVEWERLQSKA
ncbi:hypothetical protein EHS25_008004 [Saitozyma podzolica]|uniref:Glycosyl hydrolase family 88 n=1 Tax=Saitozyma podzolica TaxID=1890683 RepID=A0A427YNC1_9TREE|nr:hypothetical protein EHS25_008004 [Saitozyma podzolica]